MHANRHECSQPRNNMQRNPSTSLFLPFLLNLFHKNHVYDIANIFSKNRRHVRDELNKKKIERNFFRSTAHFLTTEYIKIYEETSKHPKNKIYFLYKVSHL
jgi:hypothetical protein